MHETISTPDGEGAICGTSRMAFDAALNAARADGQRAAMARVCAAIGADEIKRDPRRLAAAVDLVVKAPDMSGETIAAFVVANIAAANPATVAVEDYVARRAALHVVPARRVDEATSGGEVETSESGPAGGAS